MHFHRPNSVPYSVFVVLLRIQNFENSAFSEINFSTEPGFVIIGKNQGKNQFGYLYIFLQPFSKDKKLLNIQK